MRKITESDIQKMLQVKIQESLRVTAGSGKNQKPIISPGLKITHKQSGFMYTVEKIIKKGKNIFLVGRSGDGNEITITPNQFKDYEG